MKLFFSSILSCIVFLANFQNSVLLLDYQINRKVYEKHCINKDKPKMNCHGKCQMKEKEETSENAEQTEFVKINLKFNILQIKYIDFPKPPVASVEKPRYRFWDEDLSEGYFKILPPPPQNWV